MSFTVKQLKPNVILITLHGELTASQARRMYQETDHLLSAMVAPVYRVVDVTDLQSNFHSIMNILREIETDIAGTPRDPRLINAYIGRERFAMMARDIFGQQGISIPVFDHLADVLSAIESGRLA